MGKSELMELAKNGVSMDDNETHQDLPGEVDNQNIGAKEETSPSPESQKTSQGGGENATENVSDPDDSASKLRQTAFKEASEWKRRYQQLEDRLGQVEKKYTTQLEQALGNMNKSPEQKAQLPPEQKQALMDLVKLIKSEPDAAKELGLGSNEAIQSEINRIQYERNQESFNSEFSRVVDSTASKYGLNADELSEQITDFIKEDPMFADRQYSPGLVEKAVKMMLFDRMDELKTRETNLKLIQEQKQKKSQNTESASKGKNAAAATLPLNRKEWMKQKIQEAGGLDF